MNRRLILASSSPRRRQLLTEHGIEHEAIAPPLDDGDLMPGQTTPEGWVVALAHLKARAVADSIQDDDALVLGSDTVVVKAGAIIGQPRDRDHAREIINTLNNGEHRVITGVALVVPGSGERRLLLDSARVAVGNLDVDAVERYLDSGDWAGKAGAYNLMERIGAGWPIEYAGDPTTVMGLPMQRLAPILNPTATQTQE